jgi:hypothetical protein
MSDQDDRQASIFAAQLVGQWKRRFGKPLEGDLQVVLQVGEFKVTYKDDDHVTVVAASNWDTVFERFLEKDGRDRLRKQVDVVFYDTFNARGAILEHDLINWPPVGEGTPPALAEAFLVLLTDKRRSDALLGDLEERFHRDRLTRGLRHARLLYWSRALNSIRPLLWPAVKRLFTFVVGVVVGRTSRAWA